MGLRWHALELIDVMKPHLPDNPVCYMIGTMDCGFTYSQLIKRYPEKESKIKRNVQDLRKACDLRTLFDILDFASVVTVDMNDRADIYIDLSKTIPAEHMGKADLVCDFGTLEHIFDAKAAVENMNLFLKRGGIMCHMSPVSFCRHGFVNFNPSFFDSLYMGSKYKQIFRTMNVSIYNPFYVIITADLSGWFRKCVSLTNRIFRRAVLYRFNIPLSTKGNNRFLSFFNFWITHFRITKNLMYCCAYQKFSNSLRIPYDVWE